MIEPKLTFATKVNFLLSSYVIHPYMSVMGGGGKMKLNDQMLRRILNLDFNSFVMRGFNSLNELMKTPTSNYSY